MQSQSEFPVTLTLWLLTRLRPVSYTHLWYVVPADDKENARLIVSQIVLDALGELKMAYPRTTAKRRLELHSIKKLLVK